VKYIEHEECHRKILVNQAPEGLFSVEDTDEFTPDFDTFSIKFRISGWNSWGWYGCLKCSAPWCYFA